MVKNWMLKSEEKNKQYRQFVSHVASELFYINTKLCKQDKNEKSININMKMLFGW